MKNIYLADALYKKMGKRLLGRTIRTVRYGAWPGGLAKVIKLKPDRSAPEIVFQVRHMTWAGNSQCDREIGVFDHEEVELIPE